MPDSTLSQAIKEAYAAAPCSSIIYHTLELWHPSFTTPIRVVRDENGQDLTATLEASAPRNPSTAVTFVGFAFDFVPPDVGTALPQIIIEMDNVDRAIVASIESAMGSTDLITAIYRQFLSDDLSGPENDPPLEMTLTQITADVFRVRAVAGFGDVTNRRFPRVDYTAETFPGLISQ